MSRYRPECEWRWQWEILHHIKGVFHFDSLSSLAEVWCMSVSVGFCVNGSRTSTPLFTLTTWKHADIWNQIKQFLSWRLQVRVLLLKVSVLSDGFCTKLSLKLLCLLNWLQFFKSHAYGMQMMRKISWRTSWKPDTPSQINHLPLCHHCLFSTRKRFAWGQCPGLQFPCKRMLTLPLVPGSYRKDHVEEHLCTFCIFRKPMLRKYISVTALLRYIEQNLQQSNPAVQSKVRLVFHFKHI